MRTYRAAFCIALLAAIVAGCSPFSRGRGKVQTGSVTPQVEAKAPPTVAATPSLVTFEAGLAGGLHCSGGYNPLENSLTFTAAVVCDDGRTGTVTAARSEENDPVGTLVFADGATVSVALRRLAPGDAEAPPRAAKQLPAPETSAYVN
jgi:hypothetical protein